MVVVVLALAVAITGYVGWLMWHAPDSPPTAATTSRRAQLRAMKRRLAAVMREPSDAGSGRAAQPRPMRQWEHRSTT